MGNQSAFERHVEENYVVLTLTGDGIKPQEIQHLHLDGAIPTEEEIETARFIAYDWGLSTGCANVSLDLTLRGNPVKPRQSFMVIRPRFSRVLRLRTRDEFYAVYEALVLYRDKITDLVQGDSQAEPTEKSAKQFQRKLDAAEAIAGEFEKILWGQFQ